MADRILDTESLSPNNILTRGGIRWKQMAHFEAGLLTPNPVGFDAIAGTVGNLAVINNAAIRGNFGLRVTVAGIGSEAYGRFIGPNNEKQLTLEFFVNPTDMTLAVGDTLGMFRALSSGIGGASFVLAFQNIGGTLQFAALVINDAGGNTFPWSYNITGGEEKIRIEWKASFAPGANDGISRIYSNDVLQAEAINSDNDTHDITEIQIGTVFGLDAGTNGTIDYDSIGWIDKFL